MPPPAASPSSSLRERMLQFFDDLPDDRWAAFLHVQQHARRGFLSGSKSPEEKWHYVQMVLFGAHELSLSILPKWQSLGSKPYPVIPRGLESDETFAAFERDLNAIIPKIELLAKRGTAPRSGLHTDTRLDLAKEG